MSLRVIYLLAPIAALIGAQGAMAQGTYADQAIKKLEGKWIAEGGRLISFEVRDFSAKFSDEVQPGLVVTGGYEAGSSGADIVLNYPASPALREGYKCSYNVQFPTNAKGNEMHFRLIATRVPVDAVQGGSFKCMNGLLKRTR